MLRDSLTCDICRCKFIAFQSQGVELAPFKCSFRSYSRKECGLSGPYKDQEDLILLKTCTKWL